MIEVNRSLYMDEMTGAKKDSFESIKMHMQTLLCSMNDFQQDAPPDRNSATLNCDRWKWQPKNDPLWQSKFDPPLG